MEADFKKTLYTEIKAPFPEGTIETLLFRPSGSDTFIPAVKLIHKPTKMAIICDDFPTQTENCIIATLRLRLACDKLEHQ